jgi:predicted kinase
LKELTIAKGKVRKMSKPKFIIMVGLPGSGKSSWISKNAKNYTVIELDWIRKNIFGHQFFASAEPFIIGMAKAMARMLLAQQKNVIIDSTGLTIGIRDEWINMGKEYGASIKIVWVKCDVEEAIKRDSKRENGKRVGKEVIYRMANIFMPPLNHNVKVVEVL